MQKKKSTRSRAADFVIILLCCMGTAGSGTAFWKEYNRTLVKLNEVPVGTIVFKNRTAHRKFEDRNAWDRLKQESPVYNGDTIRTAELSEAIITFRDEVTSLDLSESTLIQIFYDDRGAHVDFSGGSMNVSTGAGRNLVVSSGGSVLELGEQSEAGLYRGEEGFGVSVLEGEAALNGTNLGSGQVLSFLSNGSPDTAPRIIMASLKSITRVFEGADGTAPVHFEWNAANFTPQTRVVVEIALDKNFTRIAASRETAENQVSVPLESGTYWWRAYPVEGGNAAGRNFSSGKIEVLPSVSVAALAPEEEKEFVSEGLIPLSWSPAPGGAAYLLEVSANADMSAPAVSRRIQGTSVVQSGLQSGRWYWRVTPLFSGRRAGTLPSAVRSFSVVKGDAGPAVPSLVFPGQNARLTEGGTLSWKHDSGAAFWTVELADNPAMSNPLVNRKVDSNFYSIPKGTIQNGKAYYWRVTSHSAGGALSASSVQSFTAEAVHDLRSVFPPDNYSINAASAGGLRFTFKSGVPGTRFQLSSQRDFSSPLVNEPVEDGRSYHVVSSALKTGSWYWRIAGEGGSPASAPRRLNLVDINTAPRLSGAGDVRRGKPLMLNLDSNFDSYRVNVHNSANPRIPVLQQTAAGNSIAVETSRLEPGEYVVTVQGFNPESARSARLAGVPAEMRFTLLPEAEEPALAAVPPVPPPEPPKPLSPVSQPPPAVPPSPPLPVQQPVVHQPEAPKENETLYRDSTVSGTVPQNSQVLYTAQLAERTAMNFIWRGNAKQYRFSLYRAGGETITAPVTVNSPSFTLENPGRLTAGTYIWRVHELTAQGQWPALPSAENRFTVREGSAGVRQISTNDPGAL